MNNDPSPLIPQGSLQQASAKSKSTMRLAIFIAAILHVAIIGGILMVGCKREEPKPDVTTQQQVQHALPPLGDTYYPPATNPGPAGGTTGAPVDPLAGAVPPLPSAGSNNAVGGGLPPMGNMPALGGLGTGSEPGVGSLPGGPDVGGATPAPAPEGSEYTIAKGDTFSTIAKKNHVSLNAIVKANPGVDPTRLQIGQKIKLPVASATAAAPSGATSTSSSAGASSGGASGSYTVKSGDTLTKIARNHHVSVAALKSANGLRTDRINVGKKLKIPGAARATAPSEPAVEGTTPVDPPGATPGATPVVP